MERSFVARYSSNVRKLYLFQFLIYFQLYWPIWVIYLQQERGIPLWQIPLLDIPFWLSIVILQVPVGALADRWGRKPVLAAGALLLSLAVTLFGLAIALPLIIVSYLIWGMAMACLTGPDSAFLYDSLQALDREGEYRALYGRVWGMTVVGMLAGVLAGAPIAAATSLSFPIVLSGGMSFVAFLVSLSFQEPLERLRADAQLSYRNVISEGLRLAVHQAEVRYAVIFFGVITISTIAPIFLFQPFLVGHGVSLDLVGVWQVPALIAGIAAGVAANRWVAATGERFTFLVMPTLAVLSFVLLAAWNSFYTVVSFSALNFVAIGARPIITDYLNRRVASSQRATVVSLTSLAFSLVMMSATPLLGALADHASLTSAFWAAAGLVGLGSATVLGLWFRLPQRGLGVVSEESTGPSLSAHP